MTVTDLSRSLQTRLLSTREAAAILRVDQSTLRRWRTQKPPQGPPFIPVSDRVTGYALDDLNEWIQSRRIVPEEAA
jgi:predicted DNA-binding transcriptional regulator AlpA